MNKIILFLILIFFSSCSQNDNTAELNSTNVSLKYYIELKNKDGVDLLDPENSSAFDQNKIQIIIKNKKSETVNVINPSSQGLIKFLKKEDGKGGYFIDFSDCLFIDHSVSVVYLSLPNGDLDKITAIIKYDKNSIQKDEIFYNDQLVWNTTYISDLISIVK